MIKYLIIITILLTACSNDKNARTGYTITTTYTWEDKKQLSRADDFKIVINSPDTIGKDQDFFASIHIDNRKYNLIDASFDCNVSDTSTVDTLKGKIYGCNNRLVIEHDSVKIYFTTGQNSGKQKFHDITVLAKSSDDKYYYQKTTFDYFVK